jgi:hypothetical protein
MTPEEHDWQLAEDQELPDGEKMTARVWRCTKCFSVVYLTNEPPARYHGRFHRNMLGKPIENMGCDELIVKSVHDS